jgi:phosphate:Na+ symporter
MSIILGTLIAGLGLFFTGVKMVGTNLKQLTSRRFRLLVSKWADNGWLLGLWGAVSGAITQSMSALTFIVISLISSGMMSVKNALPIILWANTGVSILVILAVLRIEFLVLVLLGVSGLCFAFEKSFKHRNLVGAILGVGLLFYGLTLMRVSAAPVSESEWFQSLLIHTTDSYALAFMAGAFLAFVAQSAAAVSVVAITLTKAGLFNVDQTMMIIYGTNVGASFTTWFLSTGLKGTAKQLAMSQVFFNNLGGLLFVPLFYLELYTQLPLVKAGVTSVTTNIEQQMALVYLVFNLVISIALSFALNPYHRLLQRFWPPTQEEDESKVTFIHEKALNDPETAMDLVEKEQLRLVERLPLYMAGLRSALSAGEKFNLSSIHDPFKSVSTEVQFFLNELHAKDLPRLSSDRFLNLLNRQNNIDSIEDNVYRLAVSVYGSNCSDNLKELILNFVEGLDAILLTAVDAVEGQDKSDVETLIKITSDRGGLMGKIRDIYLSSEHQLSPDEKSLLLYITNLFELIIWLLRRLGMGLGTGSSFSSR